MDSNTKLPRGISKTPEYRIWIGIRARCLNPNRNGYPDYGGRGITVCEEWDDFAQFLADMGPRPSPRHSVDRIDNNGNYCPENCRWATQSEQLANQNRSTRIEYNGKVQTGTEWAREFGIKERTLFGRLQRGWDIHRALTTPVLFSNRHRSEKPTHCKRGHAFSEHGGTNKKGVLFCRTCLNAYWREHPRKRDRRKKD
jgi:hypothetical protein